ncbi:ATP-dependent nuclease [Sphingobacterium rhinopitheci]|uniref:ATP-dependent nuclease n=1 Tax=Sphingobacterium rhinopitheci TaxID=2781960 RepID=UPI001F51DBFF|nr:AAA family ATPase [Sphingobacterium rhinopitheci]MCI0921731.1 AAA family ATPase [Sphingobacterium rhinopitheci]
MKIRITKFKKIDDVEVQLKSLNIFIGTNNSGKSSFIQGIQFAISSAQTLKLKNVSWRTQSNTQTLNLDSTDFLYTPTRHIENLYHGRKLVTSQKRADRISMDFKFTEEEEESTISVSRGKNGGFATVVKGKSLGIQINDIDNPFCVYVPGIAGIPIQEKFEVPIAIKKSATRGDSNNYLRNILLDISKSEAKWNSFIYSINQIYKDIKIKVIFRDSVSEFIDVYVTTDQIELPLDSIGTGLLQTIQIFAYIEYFNPKIILLDEPDSHLHPTKQKELAKELLRRTNENQDLKVVFSTHSRYILETLEDVANVVHFQSGKSFPNIQGSKILLDIGAADAEYLFSKKNLKYIIVTEDKVDNVNEKKEFLKKFVLANGLDEDEFVLHSYEGCTKVDFAKILEGFVRKQIPGVKVIVHIDRDQKVDGDRDLIKLEDDCEKRDLQLFVTKYQEVENYFCQPEHIAEVFKIDINDIKSNYEEFVESLKEETRRKLSNFILRERKDLSLNKDGKQDIILINNIVDKWITEHLNILVPGKELLGKTKNYLQTVHHQNPNEIINISKYLIDENFKKLIT